MEVRTCRGCGKLYNYLGPNTPACPACMMAMEEKYQKCRDYIKDNPHANIQEVADANEVSVKMIKQWVREERLTFSEGSGVGLSCEGCGVMILTGRYCASCKVRFQMSLQQAARRPVVEEAKKSNSSSAGKMRFLDN